MGVATHSWHYCRILVRLVDPFASFIPRRASCARSLHRGEVAHRVHPRKRKGPAWRYRRVGRICTSSKVPVVEARGRSLLLARLVWRHHRGSILANMPLSRWGLCSRSLTKEGGEMSSHNMSHSAARSCSPKWRRGWHSGSDDDGLKRGTPPNLLKNSGSLSPPNLLKGGQTAQSVPFFFSRITSTSACS
jgi:hypothetical protein